MEIEKIYIATEVSLLSSHNAYPREGQFETVLHAVGYLKLKNNSWIAMDPKYPPINNDNFELQDCIAFYGDVQESIPINAPAPIGKEVIIRIMVDIDHAGDVADRRSRTGYMIYMQMALIDWLSKK